ncbi:hypothetical protein FS749_010205, partial [Ceratobasidium sp. UAMH 11750]
MPRKHPGPTTSHSPRALPPPQAQGAPKRPTGSTSRVASKGGNGVQRASAQGNRRPTSPAEGDNSGGNVSGEEQANPPKKKVTGKVTIKSFPEAHQPVVLEMARVARARIIANGAYDDAAAEIARYLNWPEEWPPRLARNVIVAQCLKVASDHFEMPLVFQPKHVKCVNSLITTHRSIVSDVVKPLVERHFGFTIENSQHNINLYNALVPFNFHFGDVKKQCGSFENPIILAACQAVAFGKASKVGAQFPEYFESMPPTFLAYVCALIHCVIFAYRSGEHNGEPLNIGVQSEAFHHALQFLIEMQHRQSKKMRSLRAAIFEHCMEGLEPKDKLRDMTPVPEREWTPDIDEEVEEGQIDEEGENLSGAEDDVNYSDEENREMAENSGDDRRALPFGQDYVQIGRQGAGPGDVAGNEDGME